MDDNYYRQIRIVGFILDRLKFHYVNSAFISFSFTVWGGGLFQGGIAYGCLSKNLSGVHQIWEGEIFKAVVPFCFECLIYRMAEKGTF